MLERGRNKNYHDVHMEPIRTAIEHALCFRGQISKVRWQHRRCYDCLHHLPHLLIRNQTNLWISWRMGLFLELEKRISYKLQNTYRPLSSQFNLNSGAGEGCSRLLLFVDWEFVALNIYYYSYPSTYYHLTFSHQWLV